MALTPPPSVSKATFSRIAADVGADTSLPFVIVAAGQSNTQGYDTGGSKTVQPGIYIANSVTAPTDFVSAAFGSAPLNQGTSGVTASAAASYNNAAVWFANYLRLSGLIPASRPIIILPNWFPGQSISNWVGAGAASTYWVYLQAQLALLQTQYPGAKISHVIWGQGEADSWSTATGYNTQATYAAGFATLLAQFKALPQWNADASIARPTTMGLIQLATWGSGYPTNNRNDVLELYRSGATDPAVDLIPVDGLVESTQNPGPHYDGTSLQAIGQRAFEKWRATRVGGQYGGLTGLQTPYGAADSYPNVIQGPTTGTSKLYGVSDFRTGALIVANGGTIAFPHPSNFALRPITVRVFALTASTLDFSTTGGTSGYDERAGSSISTFSAASPFIYDVQVVNALWRVRPVFPTIGTLRRYSPSALTAGASTTVSNVQGNYGHFTTNANTLTITPAPGSSVLYSNASGAAGVTTLTMAAANYTAGARIIGPDGIASQTYPVQVGSYVMTEVDSGSNIVVVYDSYARRGVTGSRPTYGTAQTGQMYYDTTLSKPIWWTGSAWKDASGASV